MLTTANGQPVVIDGGKAGIVIELSAQTGKLLWKLPVGVHSGPGDAGLLTEHATPTSPVPLPARFELEPGVFGGVESQLATNGSTTFAAVNNLGVPMSVAGVGESSPAFIASIGRATGEMVAQPAVMVVQDVADRTRLDERTDQHAAGITAAVRRITEVEQRVGRRRARA